MLKKTPLIIISFIVLFLVFFGNIFFKALKLSPVLFNVLFNKQITFKNATTNNEINILLLGRGGGTHEGPDLTDTIIFAHLNPAKNTVSLLSIPRDLWIPDLNGKINIAYAMGKSKQVNGGLLLAKAVVSKVVGQPISYAISVDFNGFVKAVDYIGGLDITVERSFDDFAYPIEGKEQDLCGLNSEDADKLVASQSAAEVFPCRFEHVHFEKGEEHMDGKRALIFVRSRYAKGREGTDFARSQRQQKGIKAFKDKVFSLQILLNPVKISQLSSTLVDSIDSDIARDELDDMIKLASKMKKASIYSSVLDIGDENEKRPGLLVNPPVFDFNGGWVLIPRLGNGNFTEIAQYVRCFTSGSPCAISPTINLKQ